MSKVSAFILAGGRSTRMGRDKAFLVLNGRTLLDRAINLASSVTRDFFVVGGQSRFENFAPVVEDIYPNRGPLGGIHAALSATSSELNLMLAVDTPFVSREFLEYLINLAERSRCMAAVPKSEGHLHPLCAVYRRDFKAICEASLEKGQNRIDVLFQNANVRIVEEDEVRGQGFSTQMFQNLNTPEQWQEIQIESEAFSNKPEGS